MAIDPPSRPTTLAAVAALAGVSKATASRALRGLAGVSPDKARAVRAAVRRLGYRPDPALAAFSRYRWPQGVRAADAVIAHLRDRWTAAHREAHAALRTRAEALGYLVQPYELGPGEDLAALAARFAERGVRGVVVDLHEERPALALPWARLAGVVLGESQPQLQLPRVSTDWGRLVDDAVRRLRAIGHRRIAHVVRRFAGRELTRELLAATAAAMTRGEVVEVPGQLRAANAALRSWWAGPRPTAVLADAPGLAHGLLAAGARIPRECAFVTLIGGGEDAGGLPASGYVLDLAARARQAVDLLHARLIHRELGTMALSSRVLLPSRWVDGATMGGAPGSG